MNKYFKVSLKVIEGHIIDEVENDVNNYLEKKMNEGFRFERLNINQIDGGYQAIVVMKRSNYKAHKMSKIHCRIKIVEAETISDLETKINIEIDKMGREHFYVLDIDVKNGEKNSFISTISFFYSNLVF